MDTIKQLKQRIADIDDDYTLIFEQQKGSSLYILKAIEPEKKGHDIRGTIEIFHQFLRG